MNCSTLWKKAYLTPFSLYVKLLVLGPKNVSVTLESPYNHLSNSFLWYITLHAKPTFWHQFLRAKKSFLASRSPSQEIFFSVKISKPRNLFGVKISKPRNLFGVKISMPKNIWASTRTFEPFWCQDLNVTRTSEPFWS